MKKSLLIFATIVFSFSLQAQNSFETSKILFIGDSHSYGRYGEVLDKYFRSKANQVTSISVCGSSPSTWITTENNLKATNCGYWKKTAPDKEIRAKSHQLSSFSSEMKSLNPNVVVISLGTNFMGSSKGFLAEKKHIESMLKLAQQTNTNCIWIGPPDLGKSQYKTNLAAGVEEIKKLVESYKCSFIDSSQLTKYPSGKSDGIHYAPSESAEWGKAVQKEIEVRFNQFGKMRGNTPPPTQHQQSVQ
ncbi:MAG: hypothetical protein BroJett040_22320 [Oligoflexia bacterium]|nr:MAG: hypothetical protein BroJett040_22320 [Oligoflexia bacterium]